MRFSAILIIQQIGNMIKVLTIISLLVIAGCRTISLQDRFVDNDRDRNIREFFQCCPSQGTKILSNNVFNSFLEAHDDGSDGRYNAATVTKEFLLFGIAAENAYLADGWDASSTDKKSREGNKQLFTVEVYDYNWEFQERINSDVGLSLDYYFNNKDTKVFMVMVAFRGTESFLNWDDMVNGNFSPVTRWLPSKNQYQMAISEFNNIRQKAELSAHGKSIYYFVTGHSLGGGLAQHVAETFPCVSAVVFNTSPITLATWLDPRSRGGYIIDIYENHDPLRIITNIFRPAIRSTGAVLSLFNIIDDSDAHKSYYKFGALNMSELPDGSDHSVIPFATGMARMLADCITNNNCHINKDQLAYAGAALYCNSSWALDKNGKIDDACPVPYRH